MFGWLSRASARASRVNRSAKPGSGAAWAGRIFSATRRSRAGWRALYTAPMPPLPRKPRISSCGKSRATSSTVGGTNGLASGRVAVSAAAPCWSRQAGQSPASAPAGSERAALRTFLWHGPIRSGFIHTPSSEAKPRKCYTLGRPPGILFPRISSFSGGGNGGCIAG